MFDLFWFSNFIKIRHIAILRPNLSKLSRSDISNIIFMINELDLLWVPNFIAMRFISFLGPNFPGMRRFILVSMSNVRCLAEILIFLVVTARSLVVILVTAHLLTDYYWWFLLVTARYCLFPLLVWTNKTSLLLLFVIISTPLKLWDITSNEKPWKSFILFFSIR